MNKSYSVMDNYTIVNTDNGIRKIETTDDVNKILIQENRIEALNDRMNEIKKRLSGFNDIEGKHKSKIKEIITNCAVGMVISAVVITSISLNIPFKEFMTILLTGEALFLAAGPVLYCKENNRYRNDQVVFHSLCEEYSMLSSQITKDKIKLNSMSKHKEDDSKLNTKKVDINDQVNYLNDLQNTLSNNKVKSKNRFKK